MKDKNIIGKKIKFLREAQGSTRQELADFLEIGYSTLANYENGNRKIPIEILFYIADFLNVEMDFLVSNETNYQEWKRSRDAFKGLIEGNNYYDYVADTLVDMGGWNIEDAPYLYREYIKANNIKVRPREILISYFEELNEDGKKEATKRVEELTYIPKYTKKEDK